MQFIVIIIYLALCAAVGIVGKDTWLGFWGIGLLSVVFTPLLVVLVLIILMARKRPKVQAQSG